MLRRRKQLYIPLHQRSPITLRLVVVLFLSVFLIAADLRGYDLLNSLRTKLSLVVYPLQYFVTLPGKAGMWLSETLASRNAILGENDQLRNENLLLKARLQKLSAMERENERLRLLLNSSVKIHEKVLVAELMDVSLNPNQHRVLIDKGSRDHVYIGQPVLDSLGVMGQVIHVNLVSSIVMLVTDPDHAVPVEINRNGQRTIAVGTGTRRKLTLPYLPHNSDIKVGDQLVTSGLGGHFPAGYPLGTILNINQDQGLPFAEVIVAPTANLEQGREVLLVWHDDHKSESDHLQDDPGQDSTKEKPITPMPSAAPKPTALLNHNSGH